MVWGACTVHSRLRWFGATVWACPAALGALNRRRGVQRNPAWASMRPTRRRLPRRPSCANRCVIRRVHRDHAPAHNSAARCPVPAARQQAGDGAGAAATRNNRCASPLAVDTCDAREARCAAGVSRRTARLLLRAVRRGLFEDVTLLLYARICFPQALEFLLEMFV